MAHPEHCFCMGSEAEDLDVILQALRSPDTSRTPKSTTPVGLTFILPLHILLVLHNLDHDRSEFLMDPLSIATGAASLAATAGTVSLWLYTLIKDIKNVDTKLAALSKEVTILTGLLASVEGTIRKSQSQSLTLAHLDDQIWLQLDNIMMDCKIALEGLDRLVDKIKSDSGSRHFMKMLKKPSMHFKVTLQKDEISEFMDKIYKLNCALQTAIAVVNISLAFRTNTSQESLFSELRGLKGLVEEALSAAHTTEVAADPFAARLTRNLHTFAKAAQKFHSSASSTASTRYDRGGQMSNTSSWGGSEFGRLNDSQRERIARWNDQLEVVEEATEDNTTATTEETPSTYQSTVITTPDLEDVTSKMRRRREINENESEAEDSGDESDVELDFLRNFDELACTSFVRQDFSKAEQFLRKAMERSTGESSGDVDSKLQRIRLAICCCLQDRWEHAAGALAPLSKSKAPSNLPVFHLLQAVSLGYLANDRLEDAHNVCKTALHGKKKILGKNSDDFHECASILASIYEKKGDPLEAEAVRLSIPPEWSPRSPENTTSGKQYILDHQTLIPVAFGKASDRTAKPSSAASPETSANDKNFAISGHWTTLVRGGLRDGTEQAKKDEDAQAPVGETDTGKVFLAQTRDEPLPRRGTGMGVLKAMDDEFSGKQIGEFDSGKEVAVDTPENGVSSKDKMHVVNEYTPYGGLSLWISPWWPASQRWEWESLIPQANLGKTRRDLDPEWFSDLELVSQLVIQSPADDLSYGQKTADGNLGDDGRLLSTRSWTVERAVNILSDVALVTGFLVALNNNVHDESGESYNVGIHLGLGDASFGMPREGSSIVSCKADVFDSAFYSHDPRHYVPGLSPPGSIKNWVDYPWNFLRMLQISDHQGVTATDLSDGLIAFKFPHWLDDSEALETTSSRLEDLEVAISQWAGEMTGEATGLTKLNAIAIAVPDVMMRQAGKILTQTLSMNPLFKQARLLPSSLAIAYSFIKEKAISPEALMAQDQNLGVVVVLNCDDVLVECASYLLLILEDAVELSPTELITADLCGSLHAEIEFAKIARHRLAATMARYKVKFTEEIIDSAIISCREQFRQEIFPFFNDDGRNWVINFEVPQGFPGDGRLEFNNEMILQCFHPSMRAIRKTAVGYVLQLYEQGYLATHFLLAGHYSSSLFLCQALRTAVGDLGMNTKFLESPHHAFASTVGTVGFLEDSRLIRSLGNT